MARIRTMFVMAILVVAGVVWAPVAQAGGNAVGVNDLAGEVAEMKDALQAAYDAARSAEAKADLAVEMTAASRVCPTDCETESELAAAQKRLVSLDRSVGWLKGKYTELETELHQTQLAIALLGVGLQLEIEALDGRVTVLEEFAVAVTAWAQDIDAWRAEVDETNTRQDEAIAGLGARTQQQGERLDDHERRLRDLEDLQLFGWVDGSIGAGMLGGGGDLVDGLSAPVFGGGGGELRARDRAGMIWILRAGAKGYYDFKVADTGTCGYLAVGTVLNPHRRQDWAIHLGGNACRLSTAKEGSFFKADRWAFNPIVEVKKSWDVGRFRFDLGVFAQASVGMWGTRNDGGKHVAFNPNGVAAGLQVGFAFGSIPDNWRTGRFANVKWRER